MATVPVRIIGDDLPGRVVGEHQNVHLGVQKGKEVVDLVPADAPSAAFDLTIERTGDGEGSGSRDVDFRGPYVHGKRGDRFLYLSWVDVDPATGAPAMFSRVKLMLAAVPADVAARAAAIHGRLSLTRPDGRLVAASVRPPAITWTAAPA